MLVWLYQAIPGSEQRADWPFEAPLFPLVIYGIDIGGTKIEFVAFGDDLEPIERSRVDTPADDYGSFLRVLTDLIQQADARFGDRPRVGLGVPGLVDRDGRALCSNLPGVSGHRVGEDIAA